MAQEMPEDLPRALVSCLGASKKAVDMWTIRFADRLRFPRVPCLGRPAAWERGEMLAFAHIPTASAAAPSFNHNRKTPWEGGSQNPLPHASAVPDHPDIRA